MEVFSAEVRLPVSAEEAFAWHRRPGAFERLSPPWVSVRILDRTGSIEPGDRVTLELARGPMRIRWQLEHTAPSAGIGFADRQIAGPFAEYHHDHLFHPRSPHECVLEDRVRFRMPGGAAGRAMAGIVRRDFQRLFAYRQRTTAADLAAHAHDPEANSLRILVSGASGLVGSALVPFLTTGGHQVSRLVRRGDRGDPDTVRWSPESGVSDAAQLEGHDAVIHLAGENIAGGRWSAERKRRIAESRVRGTRLLAEALAALEAPPRVLVCASAVGIYGDRGEEVLDETSAPGDGFLAEVCRDWEEAARPAADAGIRVVTLRFGVILGGRGGALARLAPIFRLGLGGPVGHGRQFMSWISLDDAAAICLHAIRRTSVRGPVNVVAPDAVTNRELTRVLGRVLKRPAFLPVPAFGLRALFGEMADETLLASQRARPEVLLASGFEFRSPRLDEALRHELGILS